MSATKSTDSASGAVFAPFTAFLVPVAVFVAVVLRFVTGSHLWLDEALTVNISQLPLGDLFEALRRDGHPPAYYVLLHGWMDVFGDGDGAIRALSGVFSLLTLPVAYVMGVRRGGRDVGLAVLVLTAVTPFCIRYATEARMYSMVMLLVFVGLLLADDLRAGPSRARWVGLALVTGVALLTHYWLFFLGAAAVAVLAWAWWRHGRRVEAIRIGSALAAGVVLFLPWARSFLDQMAHTGTPWATAGRPTRDFVDLMYGIGGGEHGEGVLYGALLVGLVAAGALVWRDDSGRSIVGSRVQRGANVDVALAVGTLAIGLAVGLVADSAFAARYGAVVLPMLLLAAGRGLTVLPSARIVGLAVLALGVAAGPGLGINLIRDRTQGGDHAATISRIAVEGDVVAFCPDQLGPSTTRGLGDDVVAVGLPDLDSARFVNWVDYEERNRAANPAAVAESLLELADGNRIFLVTLDGYRTYEGLCPGIQASLAAARGPAWTASEADSDVYEPSLLLVFGSGAG